jgi:hypothetical protein
MGIHFRDDPHIPIYFPVIHQFGPGDHSIQNLDVDSFCSFRSDSCRLFPEQLFPENGEP